MNTFFVLMAALALNQTPDIQFNRVLEDFAIDTLVVKRYERILSDQEYILLKCLASKDYNARVLATQHIEKMQSDAFRLLAVGCRSTDAEVRYRSETLMYDLYYCPDCFGSGLCQDCYEHYIEEIKSWTTRVCQKCSDMAWKYMRKCKTCWGSGHLLEADAAKAALEDEL